MKNDLTRDKVIAVDFDGCLCENAYPEIGAPHWDVIVTAAREREKGAALILWTCREDALLRAALEACKRWGLTFDAVNENLPEWRAAYGNDPRKIGATEYWDDRAVRMPVAPVAGNDLISRSSLLASPIRVEGYLHLSSGKTLHVEAIPVTAIENASAVDAAPMVHGRWVKDSSGVIFCSECGEEHEWQDYRASYCDACGAKMDGGTNS